MGKNINSGLGKSKIPGSKKSLRFESTVNLHFLTMTRTFSETEAVYKYFYIRSEKQFFRPLVLQAPAPQGLVLRESEWRGVG